MAIYCAIGSGFVSQRAPLVALSATETVFQVAIFITNDEFCINVDEVCI